MKKTLFAIALTASIFSSHALTVIIPRKACPATRYAAQELSEHLGKALSGKVAVVREGQKVSGQKIYLGHTALARRKGIDFSKYGMEESLIRRCKEGIIVGGGVPRGTLYGAYELLERFAGVSWLTPFSTTIPKLKKFDIPAKTDLRIKPSFDYRGIFVTTFSWHEKDFRLAHFKFRVRMRENIYWQERFTEEQKASWGITPVLGRPAPLNTLYHYIKFWPKKGMEDAFSLDGNGKRLRPKNIYGPGHVCFSSPKARKMFARQMKEFIAQDRKEFKKFPPRLYNLSINDTPDGNCVCAGCRALAKKYKASSGAMLEFVNYVAREVEKVYPDVRIQTSAYFFTEKPPVGIRPHRNVAVRVSPIDVNLSGKCKTMFPMEDPGNKFSADAIRTWSKLGGVQMWNYWVNFGGDEGNGGIANMETIYKNIRFFKKNKIDYIFSECEFVDTATFHHLRLYIGYQMKKDCTQKLETLLDKFFTGYYGPAAVPMRKLYDFLTAQLKKQPARGIRNIKAIKGDNREFFRTTEKLLTEARKLAKGDKTLLVRINREQVSLDLARYSVGDSWKKEKYLPLRTEVDQRLSKHWLSDPYRQHRMKVRVNAGSAQRKKVKFGARYPLPEKFKGKELFDITWQNFSVHITRRFGLKLVNDKEACGGKAMCLEKSPKLKNLHRFRFASGIRSRYLSRDLLRFKPQKLATDEKYHLYYYGRVTLTPLCVLWAHSHWYIQQNLDPYYRESGSNLFDVYLSLKLQGPAYSRNSKKANAIFVDRILLVRP